MELDTGDLKLDYDNVSGSGQVPAVLCCSLVLLISKYNVSLNLCLCHVLCPLGIRLNFHFFFLFSFR